MRWGEKWGKTFRGKIVYDGGVIIEERFEVIDSVGLKIHGKVNHPSGVGSGAAKALEPIVLLHGFKGFMEQPFLCLLAEGLAERGYAVFRFDATNSIGESAGDIYKSTVTGYLADALAVIDYVSQQSSLVRDRLALFGTSMGGLVATLLAERDARVKFLITHSPALDWHVLRTQGDITRWEEGQWIEFISKSKGRRFKVSFDLYTDGLKYDAYSPLKQLTIPKLFLHSEKDEAIPLSFSQKAFELAAPPKELAIVTGATHNPQEPAVIATCADEINAFLQKYP